MSDDALAFARWAHAVGRPWARPGHLSYPHAIDTTEAAVSFDSERTCAICLRPFATAADAERHEGYDCGGGCWCESACWVNYGGSCEPTSDLPLNDDLALAVLVRRLTAERDIARTDADELAETVRHLARNTSAWPGYEALDPDGVLAAHDALVAER